MSSSNEEEKQLKALTDLILSSLEANGALSSIKAKLRQTVYTAVNDENAPSSNVKDANMKTSKAQPIIKGSKPQYKTSGSGSATANSSEAQNPNNQSAVLRAIRTDDNQKLTLLLVKDLLESYNMDYSLNTFSNETNLLQDVNRASLASQTSTNQSSSKPLLVQLVSAAIKGTLPSALTTTSNTTTTTSSKNPVKSSTATTNNTSATTNKAKPSSDQSVKSSENLSNSRKFSSYNTKQNYESNGIEESMGGFDGLSIDEEDNDDDEEIEDIRKNVKSQSKKTKKITNPMFSSMDETIGASMSHGYDQSVDSMDLEQDYDYYEDISKH